jgi:hypothetical protein
LAAAPGAVTVAVERLGADGWGEDGAETLVSAAIVGIADASAASEAAGA